MSPWCHGPVVGFWLTLLAFHRSACRGRGTDPERQLQALYRIFNRQCLVWQQGMNNRSLLQAKACRSQGRQAREKRPRRGPRALPALSSLVTQTPCILLACSAWGVSSKKLLEVQQVEGLQDTLLV